MSDFTYIILDIGSTRIRGGIAGQFSPTVTIINNGYKPLHSLSTPPFLELEDYSIDDRNREMIWDHLSELYQDLIKQFQQESCNWMNDGDQNDVVIHKNLLDTMEYLPLNYAKCKIIIIDELPMMLQYKFSKILLIKMGFKSVQFLPKAILSTISSNYRNGLVIDLSWQKFKISSVIDYRIIHEVEGFNGLSGINLHFKALQKLIESRGLSTNDYGFQMIEDFIVGKCDLEIDLNEIIESLLEPVVNVILGILDQSNIDIKSLLKNNIIFDGGVSNVRGVKTMILAKVNGKCNKCLGAWQGGSIYCSTSILKRTRSIRKTEEITKDTIKDMSNDYGIQLNKLPDLINHYSIS